MARATRVSKRKRVDDVVDNDDTDAQPHPKHAKSAEENEDEAVIEPEHAHAILDVLELVDVHDFLDRVLPPNSDISLRSLLLAPSEKKTSFSTLRTVIKNLFPLTASNSRKPLSPASVHQLKFANLALSLLEQVSKFVHHPIDSSFLQSQNTHNYNRQLKYALVQHLPNQQDYWTSLNSDSEPGISSAIKLLPTAHAELVAILPTPSSSTAKKPVPNLDAYAPVKTYSSIKPLPTHRTVTAGSFLDYGGPWTSFAPTFDHNGEVVGRDELALSLYASYEKRQQRKRIGGSREEGEEVFLDLLTADSGMGESANPPPTVDMDANQSVDLDNELNELLPVSEAASVKAALNSLELEIAVQELLGRNRRSLVRLEELQIKRIIKEGESSKVVEGSEEWDLAQGIMDTLTTLASLRPRTSSFSGEKSILPSPKTLHALHRTLALEPSVGWYGTLPPATSTTSTTSGALRDNMTVKKTTGAAKAAAAAAAAATATTSRTTPEAGTGQGTTGTTAPVTMTTGPVPMGYSGYPYTYSQSGAQGYRPATTTGTMTNGTTTGAQATPYTPYGSQYYAYTPPQAGVGGVQQQQQSYYGMGGGGQQQGYTAAAAAYSGWYNAAAVAYQQAAVAHQQQQQQTGQGGGAAQGGLMQAQLQQIQHLAQQAQAAQQSVQVQTGSDGRGTPQPSTATTYGSFFGGLGGGTGIRAVANTVTQTQAGGGYQYTYQPQK